MLLIFLSGCAIIRRCTGSVLGYEFWLNNKEKKMSQRALFVLVVLVLFTIQLVACATTTHTVRERPAVPLSEAELSTLTPDEQKELQGYSDTQPQYFPEAVVYTETNFSYSPSFEAYEKQNKRPTEGGGYEMPAIKISVKHSSGRTGPHVLWMTEAVDTCIPDTKDCSSSFTRTAVVFRQSQVKISAEDIPYQFRKSVHRGDKSVAMLDITKQEIDLIITVAKQLRAQGKLGDDCHSLKVDGFVSFRDDPLRERVVATLTGPADYYLTYQQATEMHRQLTEYSFALAGCYDGAPNNQKGEHIARGEKIVNAVLLGPPN